MFLFLLQDFVMSKACKHGSPFAANEKDARDA